LSGCSLTHRTDGDAVEIAGETAGVTSSGGTQQDQKTRKTTRVYPSNWLQRFALLT
jgi:hypothetical protein